MEDDKDDISVAGTERPCVVLAFDDPNDAAAAATELALLLLGDTYDLADQSFTVVQKAAWVSVCNIDDETAARWDTEQDNGGLLDDAIYDAIEQADAPNLRIYRGDFDDMVDDIKNTDNEEDET